MPSLEQLWGPQLRGPLNTKAGSASNQWAGRATVDSGGATVTVSTTLVGSNSIIILGAPEAGSGVVSGSAPIDVLCKSPGNFFTIGTRDAVALKDNAVVPWVLIKVS